MDSSTSLSVENLHSFFRILQEGMALRHHLDLLRWLQGEMQHYLPHEIMLVAWGDFDSNSISHYMVSSLSGIGVSQFKQENLSSWLQGAYRRWAEQGKAPYTSDISNSSILRAKDHAQCGWDKILQKMNSFLLHGMIGYQGQDGRIYIIFSSRDKFDNSTRSFIEILLPHLDTALRRIVPFTGKHALEKDGWGLSGREAEIMNWVRKGKTNAEIGSILSISAFTVKNHLHRIFQKLDVYNRTQAVSKIECRRSPDLVMYQDSRY